MGDLIGTQADQPVGIVGLNSSGVTTNNVNADSNGNLLVKDFADGTTGSAVPSVTTQIGGSDGTDLRTLLTDTDGTLKQDLTKVGGTSVSLGATTPAASIPVVQPADSTPATVNITAVDSASTTTSGQQGQSIITGTPTANSAASFTIVSLQGGRVQVTGTWTGTLQSEVSFDSGTTWYVNSIHLTGTTFTQSTFTGNFGALVDLGAATNYRIRATAFASGTATVRLLESTTSNTAVVGLTAQVVGNAASATSDVGNPVKTGGIFNTSSPSYLTNAQRGNHAVDLVGRQIVTKEMSSFTRWGQAFHATTNHISTGATGETSLFLLKNPTGSGKSIRINRLIVSAPSRTAGNFNTYRFYMNPTVTANGTTLVATGARQTNQNASIANVFSLPTTSANGTVFFQIDLALGADPFEVFRDFSKWIEAGNEILVTTTLSNAADTASVSVEWAEE